MSTRVLESALELAERGWLVFPVNLDKSPATPNGFKDASLDASVIRHLWATSSGVGVGVRTGAESGLVVLDVDVAKGGFESLDRLITKFGALPRTLEVETGGGGRHFYFSHPGGDIRCSAGKIGPGLDLRADGGYVVAPPSGHPSGTDYDWAAGCAPDDAPLAEPPAWILSHEEPKTARQNPSTPDPKFPEGQRNSSLASLAGRMRSSGFESNEIEAALQVANQRRCAPPLDEDEVAKIAQSVSRYEAGSPAAEASILRTPLEVMTAPELCSLPDPLREAQVVGPVVVRGARTVLGAATGEGKTTFALQLAMAAALGREFLGWRGSGCNVLMIDAEQGLRTIKTRLRESGLDTRPEMHYVRAPDGLELETQGSDVMELEAIFAKGDYGLVIADPLYKLHRGDSNEERAAVDLMRRLDYWRETYGFALLMLTHRRKHQMGSTKFVMDDLFGSSGYVRGAEVVLGLRRVSPGVAKLYFFKDRDGDLPTGTEWNLTFDKEGPGFEHDPEDDKPRQTAREKIYDLLDEEPDQSLDELAKAAGCSGRTARKALNEIGASSTTGKHGMKLWRLGEEGDES